MEDGSHLQELLESLEAGVLTLERDSDVDPAAAIHRIFQSAHNLKSGLAMAGLVKASKLFHGLEDGLDDIRRGRLVWSSAWADAVLDTVDRVQSCLQQGSDEALDVRFSAPESGGPVVPPLSAEELVAAAKAAALGEQLFRIDKLFLPGLSQDDFEGHMILDDIRENGTLLNTQPSWASYSQATEAVVVRYLFSSSQSAEQLGQLFFDPLIPLSEPVQPTAPDLPSGRFRFLVVDDDRILAQLTLKTLQDYGEVETASDGAEGLKAYQAAFDAGRPFDVVILDIEMPEVDGHGVLRAIRDYEESHGVHGLDRCIVYMNTSNDDLTKVKASFKLQADRYFIKPLSTEQMKKKLEETLPWLETRRRGVV